MVCIRSHVRRNLKLCYMNSRWIPWLICFFLVVDAVGCRLMHVRREMHQVDAQACIEGDILTLSSTSAAVAPTVVAAFKARRTGMDQPHLSSYTLLTRPGQYKLCLSPGLYEIWAFADVNHNFTLDTDEPFGVAHGGQPVEVEPKRKYSSWNIAVRATQTPNPMIIDISTSALNPELTASLKNIGEVVLLTDSRFSTRMQTYGLWRPVSSVRKGMLGLFFLDTYKPCRVPILFIHGMSGSPRDFKELIDEIDIKRFQPWVFSYPSNLSLDTLSNYLFLALQKVRLQHRFDAMLVVAHSMGGLIARNLLLKLQDNQDVGLKVPLFLSLSTPWNGHSGAKSGLKYSPIVIPSWVDIVPNSPFIEGLYEAQRLEATEHHLWYGVAEDQQGDGTLSIESMTYSRAFDEATDVRQFVANHRSILTKETILTEFNRLIQGEDTARSMRLGSGARVDTICSKYNQDE